MTRPSLPPGHRWAEGPAGPVEYLVTGSGEPVTMFVPGMTGSIAQTRPFGSGVGGSRVFLHLRGHGATPVPAGADGAPDPGGCPDLAAEVAAVAAATGATRALGVSLGAAALLRWLADRPDALDRVVLVLPAALPDGDDRADGDRRAAGAVGASSGATRARLLAMADAVTAADVESLARLLRAHQPAAVRGRPDVALWARRRAAELAGTPLAPVLRRFAGLAPPVAPEELARITCPVLVVAQEGDEVHPVAAARRYAESLPDARLEVLPAGAVLWTGRDRLRDLVAGFLDGPAPRPGPTTDAVA
ncbi:MAG TPA: alpha/beta hydrolase [Kineosporiaceae bacterium]|nr:alpha/beta hydrolase [Kineosporiaceae bacterium]